MHRHIFLVGLVHTRTSWRSPGGVTLAVALLAMLLWGSANPLYGYTYARVALGSNILVDGERVIFAQGTGSLTVIDLETGNVLLRKKPAKSFPYSGRLQNTNHGVLMMGYDSIALLDGRTFDIIWQTNGCCDAAMDGEHVVYHDGNHTVSCRKVQSGKLCWTTQMNGGWQLTAANGMALVSTPHYRDLQSALLILDLETGRELLRHQAPAGVHWLRVYFDGKQIYMVDDGGIKGQWHQGEPYHLQTVDLQGNIVTRTDYKSPEVVPSHKWCWNGSFLWGDKYFREDSVRTVNIHERKAIVEFWNEANRLPFDLQSPANRWSERRFLPEVLASGVFMNVPAQDALGEVGQLLQAILPQGVWKAYAPHLGKHGEVFQVAEAQGRILLGSSEGQVECLDMETGRPRWIYCFPTIRETTTYQARELPPRLAEQHAIYWDTVSKMTVPCGSIVLPQGFDVRSTRWADLQNTATYAGQITADPSVDDPFTELRWNLTIFFVLVPLLIAIVLGLRFAWRRGLDPKNVQPAGGSGLMHQVIWCIAMSVLPAYGLFAYGGVNYSWTVALKLVFVGAIICASWSTFGLFAAKRWLASVVLTAVLIGWIYLMFGLLLYA